MMERYGTPTPPYVSWSVLARFLDAIGRAAPGRIDDSIMHSVLGAGHGGSTTRGRLQLALRFLGLVRHNGTTTPSFGGMVKQWNTEARPAALRNLLADAYGAILAECDLGRDTPMTLDRAFERYGVRSAQVRQKCVRFLIAAAQEAKLELSPFFFVRGAGRVVTRARERRSTQGIAHGAGDRAVVQVGGLTIVVRADCRLTAEQWAVVDSVLEPLRAPSIPRVVSRRRARI